ncbi:MAG: transglutaminase domain-containing protein [Oscillospiraceae bacterium]|nr:transglutaminase domain-containing protein [Oscillospiraceae bacterium]
MEHDVYTLQGESQRYSRYETRIQRIGQALGWARRHRIVLALTALWITVAVVGLLLAVGSFTGSLTFETLTYGGSPPCTIHAFLSDVRYQYAPAEGEAVWSDESPTLPGKYRIRAVSKNGFGRERYSDPATFTLLPRDLDVQIHAGTFVYGSSTMDIAKANTELTGLAAGDQARLLEYTATPNHKGDHTVSLKTIQIFNSAGQDVTACYRVSSTDGYFTLTPRPITISVSDAQKVYDGEGWDLAEWGLTDGLLAHDDVLQVTFAPAPTDAGTHPLVPQCVVHDKTGADVTGRYQIDVEEGTLTVLPRSITVQTGSAAKTYDATPLTASQWSILEGAPIQGHTLVGTVTGTQTAAGQSSNTIHLKVLDANGEDVSRNYALILKPGTLTVTPIVLRFETGSAQKVYDGLMLTQPDCRLLSGRPLEGHQLVYYTNIGQTNVGSTYNDLFVMVEDAAGNDVTQAGYAIEIDRGTLTVTPRPITITSDSAQKLYDGYPLLCHTYQLDAHAFDLGTWDEHISRTVFTGSQTNVGSSANTFTVEIASYDGEITTFNYSITYVYGTLTVLENPDPPDDPPSPTPGLGLPDEETTITFPETQSDLLYAQVEGYGGFQVAQQIYFRYLSYGDYTGSGWSAAQGYPVSKETPLEFVGRSLRENANIQIHRINDCPALLPYFTMWANHEVAQTSDCCYTQDKLTYNVDMATGYAYQDLKDMMVISDLRPEEAAYCRFVHAQYLQIPDSTKQALLQWADRHGIRGDSPTLAEDIQSAIINAAEYDPYGANYPQGVDVAVYFLNEAKAGICQHFATAATLMYRAFGIPARYTVGFVDTIQKGVIVDLTSQDAHAWVEIYVDGLGWVPMEVTGGSLSQNVKTELHIQACSVTKIYDGNAFEGYDLTQCVISSGTLRKDHRLEVTTATGDTASTPGEYWNRIERCVIYDENGKDVTAQYYNIHLDYGLLKILPRQITVTIGSASKVYDGRPLICREHWISQGSLAPGHSVEVQIDTVLLDPGKTENPASKVRILEKGSNGNEIDRTGCYEITVIPGTLEITDPGST